MDDAIVKQRTLLTEASINHRNTVQKLLRDIERSEETVGTVNLNIALAEEVLRMRTEAYRQGVVDLQTLNLPRDNLRTAQRRLICLQ
ncbi:MAG: hypothetical protein FWC36_03865 [Spirochaetes bacterium]|nr:hypothetical protein [Spirochaetota bacterium]